MTNDKPTTAMPLATEPAQNEVAANALPDKMKNVNVPSLEIDESDDFGSDPYNRTGSFCLPKFKDE